MNDSGIGGTEELTVEEESCGIGESVIFCSAVQHTIIKQMIMGEG